MKMTIYILLIQIFFAFTACTEKPGPDAGTGIVTKVQGVNANPFLGFGYNHYPMDLNTNGSDNPVWTDERFTMMKERIRAIKPGLVRMPLVRQWYNPSLKPGEYNWNSPEMLACYKFFDLYKEMGVKVLSGWWHVTDYATDKDGFKDDRNVTAFADFINYMINVKGYDNIVYMQPSNEPYGTYTTFSDWSSFMRKTYDLCKTRGYPTNRLCGPDSWDDWLGMAVQSNSRELASYNFHFYFDGTKPSSEGLGIYDQLMLQMNQVTDNSNKPVVCAESGAINGNWLDWPANKPADGIYSFSYEYGLYMTDFAIQIMKAGVASSLSWGLQGFDQNKDAGMWNNSGQWGGLKLRPLFYAWSLLCRYFPDGAAVLQMSQQSSKVKTGGVRIGSDDYSFIICNRATYEEKCTIKIPEDSEKTYYIYVYSEDSQGDGLQLSLPFTKVTADDDISVTVAGNSAVFLTTLPPIIPE